MLVAVNEQRMWWDKKNFVDIDPDLAQILEENVNLRVSVAQQRLQEVKFRVFKQVHEPSR